MIIGFDFAPLVYENLSGMLEVDMGLINDVCEIRVGRGEDLLRDSVEESKDSKITEDSRVSAVSRRTSTVITQSTNRSEKLGNK